jgi:hypothetical protein
MRTYLAIILVAVDLGILFGMIVYAIGIAHEWW